MLRLLSAAAAFAMFVAPVHAQSQQAAPHSKMAQAPKQVEYKTWDLAKKGLDSGHSNYTSAHNAYKKADLAYSSVFHSGSYPDKAKKLDESRRAKDEACSKAVNARNLWGGAIVGAQRFVAEEDKKGVVAEHHKFLNTQTQAHKAHFGC